MTDDDDGEDWRQRRLQLLRDASDPRQSILFRLISGAIVYYGDQAEAQSAKTSRQALPPVGGVEYLPPRRRAKK